MKLQFMPTANFSPHMMSSAIVYMYCDDKFPLRLQDGSQSPSPPSGNKVLPLQAERDDDKKEPYNGYYASQKNDSTMSSWCEWG